MMNTLHKFLTIAFLAVSIFVSGLNVDLVGVQNTAAGTAVSRRPADQLMSPYLRFDRFTMQPEDWIGTGRSLINIVYSHTGSTITTDFNKAWLEWVTDESLKVFLRCANVFHESLSCCFAEKWGLGGAVPYDF